MVIVGVDGSRVCVSCWVGVPVCALLTPEGAVGSACSLAPCVEGAITSEVFSGVALATSLFGGLLLKALHNLPVPADRVAALAKGLSTACFAFGVSFALSASGEEGVLVRVVIHLRDIRRVPFSGKASSLALAFLAEAFPDEAPNSAHRFAHEAPVSGLGSIHGPEQFLFLLVNRQMGDVREILFLSDTAGCVSVCTRAVVVIIGFLGCRECPGVSGLGTAGWVTPGFWGVLVVSYRLLWWLVVRGWVGVVCVGVPSAVVTLSL